VAVHAPQEDAAAVEEEVEADDLDATADGYEADDVKCKDGEFEVTFDKDFKIIAKEGRILGP